MPTKSPPLLCELHAHTTWSDGSLTVRELCDLYGRRGFDVLAVTDHAPREPRHIQAGNYAAYLEEVEAEAVRARELYDLLVIPGLELTYDDLDPLQAAHVVAVGLREYVGLDDGLKFALACARVHGSALIAAHPYAPEQLAGATRTTAAFGAHPEFAPLVDRFELFNRRTLFGWVAAAGLPAVASGDFHRLEHLSTWKTLLPCVKDEAAVVGYLRSSRPAFLVRLDEAPAEAIAA
ncbi:MAG: UDP-N-acetylglucosamine:LPS N-acetylglucosamine transferase fused to family phosphoesterase [Actinomycetia bacterium]|nr:UDP-N-acetylglucosamine:LPS N-acetylglucosamine transferase fused to family phosphoesterase [Actinomycetes bacterium]